MLNNTQIITLLGLPGFGRATVNTILNVATYQPANLDELLKLILEIQEKISRVKIPSIAQLEHSFKLAQSTVERCNKLNIEILIPSDKKFPVRLKYIPDPPVILYVKGDVACLNAELSVAIIGTRDPSLYGEKCGERFASRFAEQQLVIVSGLAKGIDAAGHRGCLTVHGKTVAVLAQGLDTNIYPSENRQLAEDILSEHGCWVSEYTLGVRSRPNFFVERDRLQAGLSSGVVVIETDIKGGTMHTVGFCLEQKKPLGCLSHPDKYLFENDKARGNQKLILEGKAVALFSPQDMDTYVSTMEKLTEFTIRMQQQVELSEKQKHTKRDQDDDLVQINLF